MDDLTKIDFWWADFYTLTDIIETTDSLNGKKKAIQKPQIWNATAWLEKHAYITGLQKSHINLICSKWAIRLVWSFKWLFTGNLYYSLNS